MKIQYTTPLFCLLLVVAFVFLLCSFLGLALAHFEQAFDDALLSIAFFLAAGAVDEAAREKRCHAAKDNDYKLLVQRYYEMMQRRVA